MFFIDIYNYVKKAMENLKSIHDNIAVTILLKMKNTREENIEEIIKIVFWNTRELKEYGRT